MLLKQYCLGCAAPASYLSADETTRTAVGVDPQRDIERYLHDASEPDFHIRYVFLTHFHADFLADPLHDSLQQTILPLPGEVLVHPAHGTGSMLRSDLEHTRIERYETSTCSNSVGSLLGEHHDVHR